MMFKKALFVGFLWLLFIVAAYSQTPSIALAWNASLTPPANFSGYFIYRSLTTGNFPTGWVKLNPTGPTTALAYTDTTVQIGVRYFYVVTSYRGSDNSESLPSNEVNAIVNAPPLPPTNLRVTSITTARLEIDNRPVAQGPPFPIVYVVPRQTPPREVSVRVTVE